MSSSLIYSAVHHHHHFIRSVRYSSVVQKDMAAKQDTRLSKKYRSRPILKNTF